MLFPLARACGKLVGASTAGNRPHRDKNAMQDYEKLGLFYLGKTYDFKQRRLRQLGAL